jgi:hypothetical protein
LQSNKNKTTIASKTDALLTCKSSVRCVDTIVKHAFCTAVEARSAAARLPPNTLDAAPASMRRMSSTRIVVSLVAGASGSAQ